MEAPSSLARWRQPRRQPSFPSPTDWGGEEEEEEEKEEDKEENEEEEEVEEEEEEDGTMRRRGVSMSPPSGGWFSWAPLEGGAIMRRMAIGGDRGD